MMALGGNESLGVGVERRSTLAIGERVVEEGGGRGKSVDKSKRDFL